MPHQVRHIYENLEALYLCMHGGQLLTAAALRSTAVAG